MYENNLIYGKNKIERIVSVEPHDGGLSLFRELADGTVREEVIPNKYWFITNQRVSSKQKELEGDQFFKYLAEFDTLEQQRNVRKLLYQKRIEYYDVYDSKESSLLYGGITYFKGMELRDVSVLSFDIESDSLNKTKNSEIYIISNTFRRGDEIIQHSFHLDEYESQAAMLSDWCAFVRDVNPSLMIGHNIFGFDLPYIQHVADLCGTKLSLGRDGSKLRFNPYPSEYRKDGSQSYEYFNAHIYGREIIDTMFLSIKYDIVKKEFASYGLKPIITALGMEKEGRSFVDASKIKQYYNERNTNPEMWEKTKAYAAEDSDDALKLFDKMAPSYFYFTQSVSKTFQQIINGATGSQVNNMMVRGYFQDGHSIAKASEAQPFEGAISFGIPNIYKNCVKLDVASLYPSIMRAYKIYDQNKDPKQYFLQLVEMFTLERLKNKKLAKETKKQFYTDIQESQKIFINSAYGFMGANGLNYNSPVNAALVTRHGRETLIKAVELATGMNIDYWKSKIGVDSANVEND